MITNLSTKANLDTMQAELQAALTAICRKHGLLPGRTKLKYTAANVTASLEFRVDPQHAPQVVASSTENLILKQHGLGIGDRIRTHSHGICTISGFNSRAPRFPVLCSIPGSTARLKVPIATAQASLVRDTVQA